MPHLTRRFTLLRAPDGSLVSPDAMRAHLRAQRARARAKNLAAHNFLTEEEENEIIEQLRRQARYEGRDFDADKRDPQEIWNNSYASGTDGFGSWGGSPTNPGTNLQQLTESLGDLVPEGIPESQSQASSVGTRGSPSSPVSRRGESNGNNGGGGLFSGRSSERDMAYLRNVERERKTTKSDVVDAPAGQDSVVTATEAVEDNAPKSRSRTGSPEDSQTADGSSSPEASMPGDLFAVERRASQHYSNGGHSPVGSRASPLPKVHATSSFLEVPTPSREDANGSPSSRDSGLLTTLSPEAFKRVSTALEEVFDLMAAEGKTNNVPQMSDNGKSRSDPTVAPSTFASTSVIGEKSAFAPVEDDDEPLEQIGSDEEESRSRRSAESSRSFTSAVSQVPDANGFGHRQSPSIEAVLSRASENANPGRRPGLGQLGDVRIEDGDFNLGDFDATDSFAPVSTSDSSRTIMPGGFGSPSESSLAHTPGAVASPSVTPQPEHRMDNEDTKSDLNQSTSSKPPSQAGSHTESKLGLQEDQRLSVMANGHDNPESFPSSSQLPYSGSAPNEARNNLPLNRFKPSNVPSPRQDAAASALGQNMASLGEAWSPSLQETHGRKPSVTSSVGAEEVNNSGGLREGFKYPASHSRTSSIDRFGHSRNSSANLNQPSLSSIRKHYRQHSRSATNSSSEGGYMPVSPRSSGAMSPVPVLSRSARSANYFPPPSSASSMQAYASGFKPPSAVSPAAIAAAAAAAAATGSGSASPYAYNEASAMNKNVGRARDSSSTHNSHVSPVFSQANGFSPGLGHNGPSSTETGATVHSSSGIGFPALSDRSRYTNGESGGPSLSFTRPNETKFHSPSPSFGQSSQVSQASSQRSRKLSQPGNGLMPYPPSDPDQAEKWRATYGAKAADAASVHTSSDVGLDYAREGDAGDDEEDLWAQMAKAASGDAKSRDSRPVSAFPPNAPEDELAGAGITMDQLATYQAQLVRSASKKGGSPALPTTPANQMIPSFPNNAFASPASDFASPASQDGVSRLEKARERARLLADRRSRGEPISPSLSGSEKFGIDSPVSAPSWSNDTSTRTHNPLSVASQPSSSTHETGKSTRSEVMYDVTTSHRPTSPPPRTRFGSTTGLPSLMDLNASLSHPDRQSISLAQAVEQAASGTYSSGITSSALPNSSQNAPTAGSVDMHSIASGSSITQVTPIAALATARDSASVNTGSLDHPFTANWREGASEPTDRNGHPYGHFKAESKELAKDFSALPRSTSHTALANQGPGPSPATAQTAWSDPGEKDTVPGRSPFQRHVPKSSQLIDDIAAQARAATKALKGTADGTVATPPARSKTLSRTKSFKKLSKQISSPQLISTTQKLDHASQIVKPDGTPITIDQGKPSSRKTRPPVWNILSPSAVPEQPAEPSSQARSQTATHLRRSSSFGHSANYGRNMLNNQREDRHGDDGTVQYANGFSPDTCPDSRIVRPGFTHQSHQSTGNLPGSGGNSGGLSRFMSKLRTRKNSELNYGGSRIDPFPTSPSGTVGAYNMSSPALATPFSGQNARSPGSIRSPSAATQAQHAGVLESNDPEAQGAIQSPVTTETSSSDQPWRIDSTSFRRKEGPKKARTPIVLKRESEVILPGDPIPLSKAASGASAGQQSNNDAEIEVLDDSFDEPPSVSSIPIQDRWEADAAADAAVAAAIADGAELASVDAPPASAPPAPSQIPVPPPRSTSAGALAPAPSILSNSSNGSGGKTGVSDATSSPVSSAARTGNTSSRADQRKSLRDTVVRRTIIIPADINFDERRKSTVSTTSKRKSRRAMGGVPMEEMPSQSSFASLSASASSPRASSAVGDESLMSNISTVKGSPPSKRKSVQDRAPTPPGITGVGGAHRRKPSTDIPSDAPLPKLPSSTSGIATLSSQQSLKPSSASVRGSPRRNSDRFSRVQSSYAGSLYDMYIYEHGDPGSPASEEAGSRLSRFVPPSGGGDRSSRLPETRRHIEVTERADGSVVWQVIAGLADRGSVYSDYDSHAASDTSSLHLHNRDRDSLLAPVFNNGNRDSIISDELSMPTRSPAGLTNEDSRSFFAKPRGGHRKSFSFDAAAAPPLPNLPETATAPSTTGTVHPPTFEPEVFEMASPDSASPTRIVYHSDAQLANLLDALARGKDSAKFEFQAATGPSDGKTEQQSHRSRVEAEIYTLLSQQTAYEQRHGSAQWQQNS